MKILVIFLVCFVGALAALIWWIAQPVIAHSEPLPVPAANPAKLRASVEHLAGPLARRNSKNPDVLNQASEYIRTGFAAAHGRTSLQRYEVDGETYSNVIARFGPEAGDPVIIGAHYDAEEHTPGADDNASSVAGLLELARMLGEHPPSVPVELVAYTLEEPPFFRGGNMGSQRHAASLAQSGVQPKLVLVMEMIGYFSDEPGSQAYPLPQLHALYPDTGNFIAVVGNLPDTVQTRLVKQAMLRASTLPVYSINAPASIPGIDFSDHASYWPYGIPAIMLTDTAFYRNPHYHAPSDKPETLDYRRIAQVVQGVYGVIRQIEEESLQ